MSVYCGDGEPIQFYNENRQRARKEHDCCACEIPIPPGHRYWVISACWDGQVRSWKRCERCQLIHQQLRPICGRKNEWPDEELNCGHEFKEAHGRPPPEWMAALAFWQPGDRLPHVTPCAAQGVRNIDREIYYGPNYREQGCCTHKTNPYWGHGERNATHNPAHVRPCTEAQ